jgi:hypothetical protein
MPLASLPLTAARDDRDSLLLLGGQPTAKNWIV